MGVADIPVRVARCGRKRIVKATFIVPVSLRLDAVRDRVAIGLDLSRNRLDVHILSEDGTTAAVDAWPPDADSMSPHQFSNQP